MKKFFTLALVAAMSSAAAQAQTKIATLGFEPGDQKYTTEWALTPGGTYGDWVNRWVGTDDLEGFEDEWTEPYQNAKEAHSGEYCMMMENSFEKTNCGRRERGFKVGNLQLKDNTVYRLSFWAKSDNGNGRIKAAMGIGREYFDTDLKSPNGSNPNYMLEVQTSEDGSWKHYSLLTYYAGKAFYDNLAKSLSYPMTLPDGTVLAENADNGYPNKQFAIVNMYDADTYYLDDIVVEENALIAGAYCGYEAIKVDFGFPTNIADLAREAGGILTLPSECATVKINGEEQEIVSVELKNGALYIFPDASIEETDKVLVSFNAEGTGIKYAGEAAPNDGADVPSFTDEECYFDETIQEASAAYAEPKLVSSYPEDGSFEMPEDIDEFTFTFDRDINLKKIGADMMVNGKNVHLKNISEGEEGKTATFKYEGAELSKGSYTIYVYDVESAMGIDAIDEFEVTFETGKVSVAGITYTDVMTVDVQGENNMASTNWTSYKGDEVWEAAGGDQRTFVFPEGGLFTTGFYLSQRGDASATLTYGEKEDFPFVLPAGNVQITILASYWQTNSGSFKYELVDAEGNVVASGSGTATAQQADFASIPTEVSRIPFNVENCKAGNYVMKIITDNGGFVNAIIVWGLDVKTYVIGQGETADNQVIVNDPFAGIANDGVPAAGTGWHVYENDNLLEPGSVAGLRTRLFTGMGITNLANVFYNRNLGGDPHAYRISLGETKHADGGVCYDEEGNEAEKALELDNARYSISWYYLNWKGDNNTYYFKIYDEDGVEVYSREDVCTVKCDGDRNAKVETPKVEFNWTPKQPGNYVMEWYMTGESMVGNIKIEKMGSLAVYWHSQLNEAIKAAEEERSNAEGEQFAGATRDALDAAIAEAKTVTYHTGKEYTAAMERLAEYVKAMKARRDALADYENAYNDLASQISGMEGTKYEALDSYASGKALVEKYEGVEGWTIENETLLPLVAEMQTIKALNAALMDVNTGNPSQSNGVYALTYQINKLLETYDALTEAAYGEDDDPGFELVLVADEAISDDQELVAQLKKLVTATVYKALANGYEFSKEELQYPEDEPSEDNPYITVVNSIDLTGFIRNAVFYAFSPERELHNTAACNAAVPGWEFNAPNGLSLNWGWGGWDGTNFPVAPVNITNQHLGTKWATDFEVWQTITDVPVGVYSIGCNTADDSNLENEELEEKTKSYLYAEVGDDYYQVPFNIETSSNYRQESECLINEVAVAEGTVRFGANCDVDGGFAAVDNAKLLMSAPLAGFDYAKAAEAALNEFTTGIKNVESSNAADVLSTQYFDLNGRRVVNASGVLIRIDTLSNGSQRVSKVLRK